MTTNQNTTNVPTTNLDWALMSARQDADATRRDLVETMRSLACRLEVEANRLEVDGDRTVNSLGVVQGRALDVDRLCAQLQERRKTVAMLENLARHGADVEA